MTHQEQKRTIIRFGLITLLICLFFVLLVLVGNGTSARAENVRTLEQVRQYIHALELIYIEDGSYPQVPSFSCLGDYADNSCWGANGTEVPELISLNERLSHYLPLLPAGKLMQSTEKGGVGMEGYVYRSLEGGRKFEIRYVLEGNDAGCGMGDSLSIAVQESIQEDGFVRCSIIR